LLHNNTHLTLGMLLHYLGIQKIKFSADIQQIWKHANKLHFQCTDFNSSACVSVYAECIYVFFFTIVSSSLNAMLIVDKHCT